MAQKKGQTGNPNGRPKGAPNKATKELREFIKEFLESKEHDLEKAWQTLDGNQKFQAFEKLLAYSLPKLQAVDLNANVNTFEQGGLDNITFIIKGRDNE